MASGQWPVANGEKKKDKEPVGQIPLAIGHIPFAIFPSHSLHYFYRPHLLILTLREDLSWGRIRYFRCR